VVENRKAVDLIDLGDVHLQVSYTTLTLHLQNQFGAPLISASDWQIWLKVRNQRRQTVSEGGLSVHSLETAVDKKTCSIRLQLPEGTWWLEINTNGGRGKWLKARMPVVVPKSTAASELTLRFS